MKANIYFDETKNKYKFYYGDARIEAENLTINEVAIDRFLSDTSINAVQNRVVKRELDKQSGQIDMIIKNANTDSFTFYDYESLEEKAYNTDTEIGFEAVSFGLSNVIVYNPTDNDIHLTTTGNGALVLKGKGMHFLRTTSYQPFDKIYSEIPIAGKEERRLFYERFFALSYPNLKMGNAEIQDARIDYFGGEWDSAGNAIRSIMESLVNGRKDYIKDVSWKNIGYPGIGLTVENVSIQPKHAVIRVSLPEKTEIVFMSGQKIITIGDVTSESKQSGTFNTENETEYSITIHSGLDSQDDVLNGLEVYRDILDVLPDKMTELINTALGNINNVVDSSIKNINNITNTNINNINTAADNSIMNANTAIDGAKSNALGDLATQKSVALEDIAKRDETAQNNIAHRESVAHGNLSSLESQIAMNLSEDANGHLQNIQQEADRKIEEIRAEVGNSGMTQEELSEILNS